MRQMVAFTLKNAGFNVVEAVDGQDAVEKSPSSATSILVLTSTRTCPAWTASA